MADAVRKPLQEIATAPFERSLGGGLVLRSVRSERDIESIVALHSTHVSPVEGATCGALLRHFPRMGFDDFLVVEDRGSGAIVSTTCLIHWPCRFCGVPLQVAMLEMVATHPAYRHRGLVREQIRRFHEVLEERQFDLSIIQGIPYYYRQFGYAYAVDHSPLEALPLARMRGLGTEQRFRLRAAVSDDLSSLGQLFDKAMEPVQFRECRGIEDWRYLLCAAHYPVRLLVDGRDERPAGYVCTHGGGEHPLRVNEAAVFDHEAGLAVLRLLSQETNCELQLGGPPSGLLAQLARSLGSSSLPPYQWLFRIVDLRALLLKLAPVFGARLAASPFARFTGALTLNLFRQALMLVFENGRLRQVEMAGFRDASMGADPGDLAIPPDAFVRLLLGYRRLEDLYDAWPDTVVRPESRLLLQVLFPPVTSHLYMHYHYLGPVEQASTPAPGNSA